LGIDVYIDKTAGKIKSIDTILEAISAKWNTSGEAFQNAFVKAAQDTELFSEELAVALDLQEDYNKAREEYSDIEKRDVAQASSGVFRRNYFIGLIERLARAQDVLNQMMDAEGYSMRENVNTMEAYQMRVQQLKTAFTALAVEIGEAGLLSQMKGLADSTRALAEGFEKLPPELKKAIILLGETAAVFGVVNLTAKTFFSYDILGKLWNMGKGADAAAKATKAATTATIAYTGVTGGATLATNGFTLSLHGLTTAFMRLPIVGQIVLLTVLAKTIHSLTQSTKDTTKETAELMKRHSESANKAKDLADEIERLNRKYESLSNAEEGATEKSDEFKKVTKQLTDLVPSAITGFDEMGNAITNIGTASEEAGKKVAELRKEIEMHLQAKASLAQFELPQLEAKLKEAERIRDNIKSKVEIDNVQGILLGGKDTGATGGDQLKWFLNLTDDMEERARAGKLYSKAIEDAAEAIKEVEDAQRAIKEWEAYQAGTSATTTTTTTTGGGGGLKPTETPAQAYERLNKERAELRHQLNIGAVSTAQYLATLERIERDMRAAGIAEKDIWTIQEEIYSLRQQEGKSYQQWTDEQKRLAEEREREIERQSSEYRQFYDTAFNDAMSYYRHVNSLARSSRDEQIQYLKDLSRAHEWEKSKMWTLEEELFRLYQSELKDQQQGFENAHNARIKAIERERDLKIKSVQEQLDALDKEKQGDGRTEAERQHNQKMADLLKQKQYHELRTGSEHKKAIVDIERQMQEESRDWQRQIDDWRREDRKEVLQQQIEDIKKKADEEKEVWKQKYEEIKLNWDKWADNFAEAAINDPRWLEIGKIIGGQLASGFTGSIEDIDRRISNVGDTVSKIGGNSGYSGGSPAGYDVMNPNFQYLEQTWAGGARAYIEGQQKRYKQAKLDKDYDLMQRLEADARRVGYPIAHIGARVQGTGWAKLKHDERVLSPQLNFQFERLVSAMQTNRISSTGMQTRGDIVFNAPLFNAQKVEFEDSQDMEIFGREMKRHIESIRG
jgi:hypothetical protein